MYRQKPGAPVREKLAEVPMRARVPCWVRPQPDAPHAADSCRLGLPSLTGFHANGLDLRICFCMILLS